MARLFWIVAVFICLPPFRVLAETATPLHEMEFEQLLDLEVSTASRKVQPLAETPAAAFVITNDDIRRSGAVSIPEALRLAPGVEVAQISPANWSVSIRGFSGRFANKLLVLVDGRTVYTPAFAGVYWSLQDILLEDVERIEVIRGPGATLWGANAVNGVINIITRNAKDTHGGLASVRAGTAYGDAGLRWGGGFGDSGSYRVYGKAEYGRDFDAPDGGELDNGFGRQQLGFRTDWTGEARDLFSVHGKLTRLRQDEVYDFPAPDNPPSYRLREGSRGEGESAYLLGRWERSLAADSEIQLQTYIDYFDQNEAPVRERRTTFDVDFQHRLAVGDRHDVVWGLGYRRSEDSVVVDPRFVSVNEIETTLVRYSALVQDDIELVDDRFRLILGAKVEHNDLSGVEWQPNIRALWTPDAEQSAWASISRAVRTPSRGEKDFTLANNVLPPFQGINPLPLPVLLVLSGNSELDSETVIAYELGYRTRPRPGLTLDAALFYNDYDDLRTAIPGMPSFSDGVLVMNLPLQNDLYGSVYGVELSVDWRPSPQWRLQLAYTGLQMDLSSRTQPDSVTDYFEGSSPRHQLSLRGSWNPLAEIDVDFWLRAVDELPNVGEGPGLADPSIDSYLTLDARLAWRPGADMELALVGKNLLDDAREEYVREVWAVRAEVPRSLMVTFTVGF